MMSQPIVDMRAFAAQESASTDAASGFLDRLLAGLRQLPEPSDAELAEAVRERAAAYEDSQPSFAADLRAAAEVAEAAA